jgi:hypothetical protein
MWQRDDNGKETWSILHHPVNVTLHPVDVAFRHPFYPVSVTIYPVSVTRCPVGVTSHPVSVTRVVKYFIFFNSLCILNIIKHYIKQKQTCLMWVFS